MIFEVLSHGWSRSLLSLILTIEHIEDSDLFTYLGCLPKFTSYNFSLMIRWLLTSLGFCRMSAQPNASKVEFEFLISFFQIICFYRYGIVIDICIYRLCIKSCLELKDVYFDIMLTVTFFKYIYSALRSTK